MRDQETSRSSVLLAHLGSRLATGRTQTRMHGNQDAYLFLRTEKSLATRHKREHASIGAAVLSIENRSREAHPGGLRSHCFEAESAPEDDNMSSFSCRALQSRCCIAPLRPPWLFSNPCSLRRSALSLRASKLKAHVLKGSERVDRVQHSSAARACYALM